MGTETRGHTTSYGHAGTTWRRTSSDIMMAVNGLKGKLAELDFVLAYWLHTLWKYLFLHMLIYSKVNVHDFFSFSFFFLWLLYSFESCASCSDSTNLQAWIHWQLSCTTLHTGFSLWECLKVLEFWKPFPKPWSSWKAVKTWRRTWKSLKFENVVLWYCGRVLTVIVPLPCCALTRKSLTEKYDFPQLIHAFPFLVLSRSVQWLT